MSSSTAKYRNLRRLWPVAVAVLAACGGASDQIDASAVDTADAATTAAEKEAAERRRRRWWTTPPPAPAPAPEPAPAPAPEPAPAPAPAPAPPAPEPAPAPAPAPAPVPDFSGTAALSWTAVTSAPVAGYRVYYGTSSGTYVQQPGAGASAGNLTTFSAIGLQKGVTYYFAVTSVDSQGSESSFSNEASKLVQ